MPSVIDITGITGGTPPYSFYVCDIYDNNCTLFATTTGTYTLNNFYSTATELLIKVIDSNGCLVWSFNLCN
jgi:hypothetical protein